MEYETNIPTQQIDENPTPTPELRALYDGDISSQILEKLSGYYTEHSDRMNPESYFITRNGNYDYTLYYGDISESGAISSCKAVRYYGVNSGSYSIAFRLSVSELESGTVDLAGYSGYIYSSYNNAYYSAYHYAGHDSDP